MMKKPLIDGDVIVYRSAWAVQKTIYTHKATKEFFTGKKLAKEWLKENTLDEWDDNDWDIVEEIEDWPNCRFLIDNYVNSILEKYDAREYSVYLSPKKNFRHDIATIRPYKAKRPEPPFYAKRAREHLENFYQGEVGNNVEADDLLGLNQTTDTVICTNDKDLLSVPGLHYNFVTDEEIITDIYEADQMFFSQLIQGDTVDNIPGLPGFGQKTAENILMEFEGDHEGLVQYIKDLYVEHYGSEDVMLEMAQLVYILRPGDKPGEEQWRKLLGMPVSSEQKK